MDTVLVTGATGLIGSNAAAQLRESNHRVRALVRPGSRTAELEAMGVELVEGDLQDAGDVQRAAEGCDFCIHSAALVVGGPPHPYEDYHNVNVVGSRNVLDAAERAGIRRTVLLSTSAAFDRTTTMTEKSPPRDDDCGGDPYAQTKRDVVIETQRRVEKGLDAVTVLPGACFGPAPTLDRAVEPPGFNSRVVRALHGEIDSFPAAAISPVLASDVAAACISALARGVAGEVYMAWGRAEEASDGAILLDMACVSAGVPHRVKRLGPEELEKPEVMARWGPAVVRVARETPTPLFDNQLTVRRLGHRARSLQETVDTTVRWMLDNRLA